LTEECGEPQETTAKIVWGSSNTIFPDELIEKYFPGNPDTVFAPYCTPLEMYLRYTVSGRTIIVKSKRF
jgi:hypothetical protein